MLDSVEGARGDEVMGWVSGMLVGEGPGREESEDIFAVIVSTVVSIWEAIIHLGSKDPLETR